MTANFDVLPEGCFTGLLPRLTAPGGLVGVPLVGEDDVTDVPILPESEWEEPTPDEQKKLDEMVWHIFNQNPYPSCASNALAGAYHFLREQEGMERVLYSPESLHARIAGPRSGATLDTVLREMMTGGICPASVVPVKDWNMRGWSNQWKDVASQNLIKEACDLPSFEAIMSFLTVWRKPVVYGIFWGGDGGGHALYTAYARRIKGAWTLRTPNSWGENSGERGFYDVPRRHTGGLRVFGAFGLRSISRPKTEVQPPVLATAG